MSVDAIDPSLRISGVRLAVSDLPESVGFYTRVMGFPVLEQDDDHAVLGAGGAPALELVALRDALAPTPGRAGLFHVAWLHRSRAALADTVRRIAAGGWEFTGASDHGVSEALYLDDPDGLGIEVYADRPRESWRRGPGGHGVAMVTEPLDLEGLLEQSPAQPSPSLEPGTAIGHVHLKVGDVPRAFAFYSGLGFEDQARWPSAAFMSAGGYHHHLGLNSWLSAGGAPAAAEEPGLRRVSFELSRPDEVERVADAAERLGAAVEQTAGGVALRDPDGESLLFTVG